MESSAEQFYEGLSNFYHFLFEDWHQAVHRQGGILDRILRDRLRDQPLSILDCCCGIGTQAIGLALHGHHVNATDLSPAAVERAEREARDLGVSISFGVADVRTLNQQIQGTFDAVIACDNSLPHLLTDDDLQKGIHEMAARLRPGGLFLATIRDYDALVNERPASTPVRIISGPPRRVTFQVWDWSPEGKSYQVHQFIVVEETGWRLIHKAGEYRALLRDELTQKMRQAGLEEIRWQPPVETGYYQPTVTALKL